MRDSGCWMHIQHPVPSTQHPKQNPASVHSLSTKAFPSLMSLEWIIFGALVLVTVAVLGGKKLLLQKAFGYFVLIAIAATVTGAIVWQGRVTQTVQARMSVAQSAPREGRPDGYVTSESCQSCHPSQ